MNPFEQLISAGNLPNVYAAAILPTAKGSGSGSRHGSTLLEHVQWTESTESERLSWWIPNLMQSSRE